MAVKATPFLASQGADPALGRKPRSRPSRWRRSGFWSAVAGMAVAVAIACTVVAMEMVGEFDHRASHFRHRADQLQARLGRIEERLMVANHEVVEMRRQAAVREQFNRILAAPDGQLVRLEAVGQGGSARGALAFSRHLAQAVLEVTGLPQNSASPRFALHWLRRQGAPLRAAEFNAHDPGQPDIVISLAPPPLEVLAMVVDAISTNPKADPSPLLRGELRKATKH